MTSFTPFQKALVIIPKVTAFLSFWCSFFIVQNVLQRKKRRESAFHRILLGMSISDMIGSFGYFLSSWPIPHDTEPPIYGARGTTATCTAQGFFQHGGNLSAPLYNASLVTHNLLAITFMWSGARIKKVEWMFHAFPLLIGWGAAIASVVLDLYNPAHWVCFIGEYPEGCKESFWHGENADCIRGDNSSLYRFFFMYAEIWATILYVAIGMSMIYWSVLKTEREMDKYDFNGERQRSGSRKIAKRSLYYVLGLIITWLFATIVRIWEEISQYTRFQSLNLDNLTDAEKALAILMVFFLPLQGFFNFLVYVRPKYAKYRARYPGSTLLDLISTRFFASAPFSRRGYGRNNTTSTATYRKSEEGIDCDEPKTISSTKPSSMQNEKQEEPAAADTPKGSMELIRDNSEDCKKNPMPLPMSEKKEEDSA